MAGTVIQEPIPETRGLVVCIGNDLVGDDGVGIAVYEALQHAVLPAGVRLLCLGLGGLDLLEELHGEEILIVVDAVQFGAAEGTVHCLDWKQLPIGQERPVSGHGIGVREALAVGAQLYPERMPAKAWLVGIEGRCFDQLGEGLSAGVATAVQQAAVTVGRLLQGL